MKPDALAPEFFVPFHRPIPDPHLPPPVAVGTSTASLPTALSLLCQIQRKLTTHAEAARRLDVPHLQTSALLAYGNPPDSPTATPPACFFTKEGGRGCRRGFRFYPDTFVAGAASSSTEYRRDGSHLRI